MELTKTVQSSRVRDILGELMEKSFYQGYSFIIERAQKPMVAIVPIDMYQSFRKQREEDFKIFEKIWERNQNINQNRIEKDIAEAVIEVRKDTKK